MMTCRGLYVVGFCMALIGTLGIAVNMALSGWTTGVPMVLAATVAIGLGLVNTLGREDFDRDHALPYRVVNWGGGLLVVCLGLLTLAVGVVSLGVFG